MLTLVMALVAVVSGCTNSGTPATVPASVPTTTVTTATTHVVVTSSTTTTAATTTTIDRMAEIQAIFQDLEERRLRALYDGDREAFKALFANDEYMQRSMGLFDLVRFVEGWSTPSLAVVSVIADDDFCIAAEVGGDYSGVFVDGGTGSAVHVIERMGDDEWGISYVGDGWVCDGPHPLLP